VEDPPTLPQVHHTSHTPNVLHKEESLLSILSSYAPGHGNWTDHACDFMHKVFESNQYDDPLSAYGPNRN